MNIDLTNRSIKWVEKLKSTHLRLEVDRLLNFEQVEVGYRATCGSTDKTRKEYDIFMGLIKSLRDQGLVVLQERISHDNAYATNNGGFWDSYKFKIEMKNK